MWLCDVYEGALISVTAFFAIIPKTVIFCLLFKMFFVVFSSYGEFWSFWFTTTGFLSVATASVVALYQKRTKRLLAYSAIGHVGFILLGLTSGTIDSIKVSVVYLVIYMIMNVGIFSLIMGFTSTNGLLLKYLINWSFLKKWNIASAITFAILLFSVAGIPPLAGFYSKLGIILTLVLQENLFLSLVVIVCSCIGCFYYIRLIKILFFGDTKNYTLIKQTPNKGLEFCVAISVVFVCTFLLKPNFLINLVYFASLSLI
jgi:NADH-quinone oxidoreductase subunit N